VPPIVHPGSQRIAVAEPSQVGEARRAATALAASLGFDEARAGRVALAVTEAATNLVEHGAAGELLLRALPDTPGVEMLALDRGQGIRDVARALGDGFSTSGTPGTGLGAIRRTADDFDLWSAPGAGTALLARLWAEGAAPAARAPLEVGVAQLPKGREERCGDAWSMTVRATGDVLLMVADGLGHGPAAADAASEAARIFRGQAGRAPREIIEVAHAALRHTRGAAVAVALVSRAEGVVRYAGIGNIAAQIVDGAGSRSLVSLNGIVGHELRRVQEFSYPWPADGLLVMHSDGLESHWKLDGYPGLAARDPALVAGVLYRDFARGRGDVTVLVARDAPPGGAAGADGAAA
jgi:anti-sigma regulatory factor (Ser/Thr protein kinase)